MPRMTISPSSFAAVLALLVPAALGAQAAQPRTAGTPRTAVDTPPAAGVIKVTGQGEESEEEGMELFRRRRVANVGTAVLTHAAVKTHPVRRGQFLSGGFLTEAESFQFGTLLGPVTPEQIESSRTRAAVLLFTRVAVAPPEGASYAAGDTLVVAERREGPIGYGEVVVPTGLIRVTGQNGSQAIGDVIALFGPLRDGQAVLPAEKFSDPGPADYERISNGLMGRVLSVRDRRELRLPQQVLFLDIGKRDGVALGDVFEARRAPGPQGRARADAVDELMATMQVVHLRERTATVEVRNVVSPDVPPGTRVKLVARLRG